MRIGLAGGDAQGKMRMSEADWHRGFNDGERGLPRRTCPYAVGSTEHWSWSSGDIEGKAARHGYAASRPATLPEKDAPAAEPCAVALRFTAHGSAAEHPAHVCSGEQEKGAKFRAD